MKQILLGVLALTCCAQAQQAFDQAQVDRGKAAFVSACGFCHGSNARGGESGPDLLRTELVIDDLGGKQLGAFLTVGRPTAGMPAFPMPAERVADIAAFLHRSIAAAGNRKEYEILDILIGDAKRGEAFFNGSGGCKACHSPAGDFKGIGAKYQPVVLQDKIVNPRRVMNPTNPEGDLGNPNRGKKVTVTPPSGSAVSGELLFINDFYVTLRDAQGVRRTYARDRRLSKIEIKDDLQAHVDLLAKYTDQDIHDLTKYLVTLK